MADLGEPAPEVGLGAVGVGETGVVHEGPRRHSPPGEPGHVWIGRPRLDTGRAPHTVSMCETATVPSITRWPES